jgi:hypothetical protein
VLPDGHRIGLKIHLNTEGWRKRRCLFVLSGGTMTTIRQLIQNGPAKANELFAKLGDTSDTAVKTRERLFAELKEELELLARLEEEHIFPVLRKNKKTKGLVPDALSDNMLTRKLPAGVHAEGWR